MCGMLEEQVKIYGNLIIFLHFVFKRQYCVLYLGQDPVDLHVRKTYLRCALLAFTYEKCLKLLHYKKKN